MISIDIDSNHLLLIAGGCLHARLLNHGLIEKHIDIGLRTDRLTENTRHFRRSDRLLLWNRGHAGIGIEIEGILSDLYIGIIGGILIVDIISNRRHVRGGETGLICRMGRT